MILALQTEVLREVDPLKPATLTLGSIHGGAAENAHICTCSGPRMGGAYEAVADRGGLFFLWNEWEDTQSVFQYRKYG